MPIHKKKGKQRRKNPWEEYPAESGAGPLGRFCVAERLAWSFESDSLVCVRLMKGERESERKGGRAAALHCGDVAPLVFIAGWVAGR